MYNISLSPEAYKYLARLSKTDRSRLFEKIKQLPDGAIKKMKGSEMPLYRLRIWKYRVLFEKYDDRLIILVVDIWPRWDIYK